MAKSKRQSTQKQLTPENKTDRKASSQDEKPTGGYPLLSPDLFINRELSWLDFNYRVLSEVADESVPLLERTKFLAIFSSNLDEFFMIRVAGVKRKIASGIIDRGPDGRTPKEQYQSIRARVQEQISESSRLYVEAVAPSLSRSGVTITTYKDLSKRAQRALDEVFLRDVFPVLTPQAIDRARRFPHISNESLNLVVLLEAQEERRFARIKIPAVIPRLVRVPIDGSSDDSCTYVWLEDLIVEHLPRLFPGHDAGVAYSFHLTRDSDIEIDEEDDEDHDLLSIMRQMLSERTFGSVVRLTVESSMPTDICEWLLEQVGATADELYVSAAPLALQDLMEFSALDRPDLKDTPYFPAPLHNPIEPDLTAMADPNSWGTSDIFGLLRERDVMIHLPYESFNIVSDFLRTAAVDSNVVAIKQTLYRIGKDSPLIPALIEARDDDTQVAVLVELKARFDEENNITWAQQLEHHGVHVAYGLAGLKTHCKLTLVVRREEDGLRRYAHLATGNYNATTSKTYEDIGLFTSREDLTHDVSELFNVLTGYSEQDTYRKLWVAPHSLRKQFLDAIDREIAAHKQSGNGRMIFKLNSLIDREVMRAIYAASQAGVQIDLIVRGACSLRPGVTGFSENIKVRSIVGRFLEHSRIYLFSAINELYMGSPDLMERNLDRRVEVVFPVEDPHLRNHVSQIILPHYLEDNVNAWELGVDSTWKPVQKNRGEEDVDVQSDLLHWYQKGDVIGIQRKEHMPAAASTSALL